MKDKKHRPETEPQEGWRPLLLGHCCSLETPLSPTEESSSAALLQAMRAPLTVASESWTATGAAARRLQGEQRGAKQSKALIADQGLLAVLAQLCDKHIGPGVSPVALMH